MAFIVENGSGVQGANAYVQIEYVNEYFVGGKLADWTALSEQEQEIAIINATQFIDVSFDWCSLRVNR